MTYSTSIAHGLASSTSDPSFNGLNTTGADIIFAAEALYAFGHASGMSDNKGNSYTGLTEVSTFADINLRLWYVQAPTVGSSHNVSAAGSFCSMAVSAHSGSAASPFDQENSTINFNSTSSPTGSVTPGFDNEILVAAIGLHIPSGAPTIDSGFTVTDANASAGNYSVGLAFLVQTSASAVNPTWSWTGTAYGAANLSSFKAAAGAAAATVSTLPMMGVG